jgi:DNA polymerase-3 subunit beta
MNVAVAQETLAKGLALVSHAIPGTSKLPILANVLVETDNGRLKLSGTDTITGAVCWIGAKAVKEDGAALLPAKVFTEFVSNLPGGQLDLSLDTTSRTVKLTAGRYEAEFKGADPDEYPVIPQVGDCIPIVVFTPELLKEVLEQTTFAAADEDPRPVLTTVLLRLSGKTIVFAAADGFRLAVRTIELDEEIASPQDVLIPAGALKDLTPMLAGLTGDVEVSVTKTSGQVLFHTKVMDLLTRQVEGRFPAFESMIPTSYTTRAVLDRADLVRALKLSKHFAKASHNIIRLSIRPGVPGSLTISANASEVGKNSIPIDATVDHRGAGESNEIALNETFMEDMIKAMPTPQIALELVDHTRPGVFKPVGLSGYLHMIMPMQLR